MWIIKCLLKRKLGFLKWEDHEILKVDHILQKIFYTMPVKYRSKIIKMPISFISFISMFQSLFLSLSFRFFIIFWCHCSLSDHFYLFSAKAFIYFFSSHVYTLVKYGRYYFNYLKQNLRQVLLFDVYVNGMMICFSFWQKRVNTKIKHFNFDIISTTIIKHKIVIQQIQAKSIIFSQFELANLLSYF